MRPRSLFLGLIFAFLSAGCSSNPSAPAVGKVFQNTRSVVQGTEATLTVELFLSAEDVGAETRSTNPFSLLVSIPSGATFVPGTTAIPFQSSREPNSSGSCGDGRTFLLFDFLTGEFDNPFDFKEFASDISFNLAVTLAANGGKVSATASDATFSDPCQLIEDESTTLRVKES